MILVMMGVSGCGKSTIGRIVAMQHGWRFAEGDDLHPPDNVAKMARGIPLDDADRAPWLDRVAALLDRWQAEGTQGVVTCSSLKRAYRQRIIGKRMGVRLVYLHTPRAVLAARLEHRHGHYMPASLLDSQLAALEPPRADEAPIEIDVSGSANESTALVNARLQTGQTD